MTSIILLVGFSLGAWFWYFTLRGEAKHIGMRHPWMFRRQLIIASVATLLTIAYLIYLFTADIGLEYR